MKQYKTKSSNEVEALKAILKEFKWTGSASCMTSTDLYANYGWLVLFPSSKTWGFNGAEHATLRTITLEGALETITGVSLYPKRVELSPISGDYSIAEVSRNSVKVGCCVYPWTDIKKIIAAHEDLT